MVRTSIVVLLGCVVLGCSSSGRDPSPSEPLGADEELVAPTVTALSSARWAAGDAIELFGSRFVAPNDGTIAVSVSGAFVNEGGERSTVSAEFAATYVLAGRATFVFEADVPPASFGHELGVFEGTITATNVFNSGKSRESKPLEARVTAEPSIVIDRLGPSSAQCGDKRVGGTLSGELVALDVSFTGLGTASVYQPIDLTAAWVDTAGNVMSETQQLSDGTQASFVIDPGVLPTELTGDQPADELPVSVSVSASRDGVALERVVSFALRQPYTVAYSGQREIVKVYEPEPVTGCISGGQYGSSVSYNESESESESRSYSFSGNFAVDVWILNLGFGFGVTSSVSSGSSSGVGASQKVFPHWFGAFYRQKSRLKKTGIAYENDACGGQSKLGYVFVTDWVWAPGFAQKNEACPPLPTPVLSATGEFAEGL